MTLNNGVSAADDGYVFNPNDIVRDTGDAYIVRHGDHYHYIPKSSLNNPHHTLTRKRQEVLLVLY